MVKVYRGLASVKSIRFVVGILEFYPCSGHTEYFKNSRPIRFRSAFKILEGIEILRK